MRVAILAPIGTSLYSRLVAQLLHMEQGVELTDVIVRTPWTLKRIRSEWRRDGGRLLRKAFRKLVLKERAYGDRPETIVQLARQHSLPGRNLYELADACGFRIHTVIDHNDSVSVEALKNSRPDVIVFTGGGLIRQPVLDIPRLGVLNCHMGVLPKYRGMDVVEWPLLAGDGQSSPELGLTVHFMDRGVDTGPILLERRFSIEAGETFARIRERMEPMMVELMLETVRGLRDEQLSPIAQEADDGLQYFVMHARLFKQAEHRLASVAEACRRCQEALASM
jgi:methionyl-tRNA formyltransferase